MRLVHSAPDHLDLHNDHFRVDFGHHPALNSGSNTLFDNISGWQKKPAVSIPVFPEPLMAIRPARDRIPVLISGFRRLHQALENGLQKIPVLVFSPSEIFQGRSGIRDWSEGSLCDAAQAETSDRKWMAAGWLLALCYVSPVHHSPLEIAAVLNRACRSFNQLLHNMAALCPAVATSPQLNEYLSAASLPRACLVRFSRWNIDLAKAALLARYSECERPVVTMLTCCLSRFSVSQMRRFEELVRDIALRNRRTVVRELRLLQQRIVQSDRFLVDGGKRLVAGSLLADLESIRSPDRARMAERFDGVQKQVGHRDIVRIEPPRDFEGDYFDLHIRVRNTHDLNRVLEDFKRQSSTFDELLKIIRDGGDDSL